MGSSRKSVRPLDVGLTDFCRDLLGLRQYLGRKLVRQLVLADDHLDVDLRIVGIAQNLDDTTLRVTTTVTLGILGDLGTYDLPRLGVADVTLGNVDLVADANVKRNDVGEATAPLERADDLGASAPQKANDAPLGLAPATRLMAGDNDVAVHGVAELVTWDVEVRLPQIARHDEAEPLLVARQRADDEVHTRRQAVALVAGFDDLAVGDQGLEGAV